MFVWIVEFNPSRIFGYSITRYNLVRKTPKGVTVMDYGRTRTIQDTGRQQFFFKEKDLIAFVSEQKKKGIEDARKRLKAFLAELPPFPEGPIEL